MSLRTALAALGTVCVLAACSAPAPEAPPPRAVLVRSFASATAPQALQHYAGEVRARI